MTLPPTSLGRPSQQDLYDEAAATHGAALERLARSYEADPDKRQDLLQDIHLSIWRSFQYFDGRCSLRTWVYRVAHNVATSHMISQRRGSSRLFVGLDTLESIPGDNDTERFADRQMMLDRLSAMIQQLKPVDRQVMLLYLEGTDAAAIGEITGISAGNVATKVSRIKKLLGRRVERKEEPMTPDDDAVDLRSLWQSQPTNSFRMSPDQMRARNERLDGKLRRDTHLLHGVGALAIAAFTLFFFVFSNPLQRIGSVLTVIGLGYLIYHIRQHRTNRTGMTAAVSGEPSAEHYRMALERQRDFHRGIWFWSPSVIVVPGPLLFLLGAVQAEAFVTSVVLAVGAAVTFLAAVAIWLNLRLARRYQARIDDVKHLQQEHR